MNLMLTIIKQNLVFISFMFLFMLVGTPTLSAQEADTCPQTDLPDIISSWLNKEPKAKTDGEGSLLLLPIIGSNPATGFMVGVGGQYAFKMPESSHYSLISGSIQFTTKRR